MREPYCLTSTGLWNYTRLHNVATHELYAMMYGSVKPMQARIDEDGSGAVFAALLSD